MSSGQVLAVAFGFSPGHIYSTQFFGTDISEYSANGRLLATTSIQGLQPGEETKGLGFGPDGNLYIVLDRLFEGARLVSVDSTGAIVNSYELPVATGGNLSYGKLGFDDDGTVYIGTGAGIVRVLLDDANSAQLLGDDTADAFDLSVLPDGNLLRLSGNQLDEIDTAGSLIRNIALSDPNGVSDANFFLVNDLRGLEYDVSTDRVFISMLGNSDNLFFKTMIFDFATGVPLDIETFTYGDDMFLAGNTLLLGSRVEAPWILSPSDLSIVGRLEGAARMFVTRNGLAIVGEPGSFQLLSAALLLMIAVRTGFRRIPKAHLRRPAHGQQDSKSSGNKSDL